MNWYVSNVSALAPTCTIHIGKVEVLNQSLTGWTGQLVVDGAQLSPPHLPPGHYLECSDVFSATDCQVFDAAGNQVNLGPTSVDVHARNSSPYKIDVVAKAVGRIELVIIEANQSTEVMYADGGQG